MAMGSWLDRSMNHETRPGGMFEAVSSGPGDAAVSALIGLKRAGPVRAQLNAGVSIPVGSIRPRLTSGVGPQRAASPANRRRDAATRHMTAENAPGPIAKRPD